MNNSIEKSDEPIKMKVKKRYWVLTFGLLILIVYLFWGPLFPWNPIKSGYEIISSSKATVYFSDLSERDSVVYHIEEIIREEEKFHDLKYADDFKIIILKKDSNMKRYLPWLKGSGYSVSLSLANVVYIGPTARKSSAGIEPYLKHELSHLLVGQNTTFKNGLKILDQGWFGEGIAEYFSGHSFYDKDEFLQLWKINNLQLSGLFEQNPHKMSAEELKLRYSYYGFFIEFLVENFGINKLQQYLKRYINNPENYKELFVEVYAVDFDQVVEQFDLSLNN